MGADWLEANIKTGMLLSFANMDRHFSTAAQSLIALGEMCWVFVTQRYLYPGFVADRRRLHGIALIGVTDQAVQVSIPTEGAVTKYILRMQYLQQGPFFINPCVYLSLPQIYLRLV